MMKVLITHGNCMMRTTKHLIAHLGVRVVNFKIMLKQNFSIHENLHLVKIPVINYGKTINPLYSKTTYAATHIQLHTFSGTLLYPNNVFVVTV